MKRIFALLAAACAPTLTPKAAPTPTGIAHADVPMAIPASVIEAVNAPTINAMCDAFTWDAVMFYEAPSNAYAHYMLLEIASRCSSVLPDVAAAAARAHHDKTLYQANKSLSSFAKDLPSGCGSNLKRCNVPAELWPADSRAEPCCVLKGFYGLIVKVEPHVDDVRSREMLRKLVYAIVGDPEKRAVLRSHMD